MIPRFARDKLGRDKLNHVNDYFAARRAQLDEYFQNVAARTGAPKPLGEPLARARKFIPRCEAARDQRNHRANAIDQRGVTDDPALRTG